VCRYIVAKSVELAEVENDVKEQRMLREYAEAQESAEIAATEVRLYTLTSVDT
jgi:hypothetical protein